MIEIRPTEPDEYRAVSSVVTTALMHAPLNDEDWSKAGRIESWENSDSLSAWEDGRCVGHAGGFRFETIVPGGARLATNGVSRVGVLATHRRQGVARRLLTRLLTDAADRGQVLASLRASEPLIYQRYGFGLAGEAAEITLDPSSALPLSGAAPGTMRLLAPDEFRATVAPLYERSACRPGVISRPDWMWKRFLEAASELGGDAEFVAVHTSPDGIDDGFVHYSVKWKTERFTPPGGQGEVLDLWGFDPLVELALWEYLCGVDLVNEWHAEARPVDDFVRLAVADRRSHRSRWHWDEQWLRVLDVDAALAARTYGDFDDVVTVEVVDDLLPRNAGRWEISPVGAKRAGYAAPEADIVLDVAALAAVYLGGTKWSALAMVGALDVRRAGAIPAADALFAVPAAAFCGSDF